MVLNKKMAPVYGFTTMYDNAGELQTRGVEAAFSWTLMDKSSFRWIVGGNIAAYTSEVKSLGGAKSRLVEVMDDVQLNSRVGSAPNVFWGYQVDRCRFESRAGRLG